MRHALFLMILFLSLSCTSRSQARRDSINTLSDTLSTPDSIMSADTLRLLFVGDLMQHQGQINAARTATGTYDYSACFEYVKEEIGSVDLAIANLEVTLGGKPYKGYPAFSAPDEFLTAIHDAGFNVLVTANNHSLDRGRSGLERTILLIDSLIYISAGVVDWRVIARLLIGIGGLIVDGFLVFLYKKLQFFSNYCNIFSTYWKLEA